MKGLASLLLGIGEADPLTICLPTNATIGDDAPPKNNGEENEILKILNSNGVSYTHHNDDLLKVSAIETRLAKKAIEVRIFANSSLDDLAVRILRRSVGEKKRLDAPIKGKIARKTHLIQTGLRKEGITSLIWRSK